MLLLSSWPNAMFDLCGICCGHFMMPFWEFFGAVYIGKALFKSTAQAAALVTIFSRDHREDVLRVVERLFPGRIHALDRYLPPDLRKPPAELLHHVINGKIDAFQQGLEVRAAAAGQPPRCGALPSPPRLPAEPARPLPFSARVHSITTHSTHHPGTECGMPMPVCLPQLCVSDTLSSCYPFNPQHHTAASKSPSFPQHGAASSAPQDTHKTIPVCALYIHFSIVWPCWHPVHPVGDTCAPCLLAMAPHVCARPAWVGGTGQISRSSVLPISSRLSNGCSTGRCARTAGGRQQGH